MPKTRVRPTHRLPAVWLPLVALALVILTLPNPTHLAPPPEGSAPAGGVSMRIHIDPETGHLLPLSSSPELSTKAAMPNLSRSMEGLSPKTLPNGSVMVNLQGRFQNATIARIGSDGKVHTICTEDARTAQRFLNEDEVGSPVNPSPRPAEVK